MVWYMENVCTYFGNYYAAGQIFYDENGQRVKIRWPSGHTGKDTFKKNNITNLRQPP